MKLRSLRRRIQWPITFALVWPALALLRWLPLGLVRRLGRVLGVVVLWHPGMRRTSRANLRVAFPEWDAPRIRETSRRSAQHMVTGLFEFIWLQARPQRVTEFVSLSPAARETLLTARGTQGLLSFSPHLGNWELGNLALNHAGIHTAAVARKQPNPFIQRLIERQRLSFGGRIIWEKGAAKGILKALKQKELVMILVDQNTKPHAGGIFVDFFGLPAAMSRAPAMFARRTGARLVMATCIRREDGSYAIELGELSQPVAEFPTDEEVCAEINRMTEDLIRRYPEQYIWMYGRYRYIPSNWEGDRNRYPFYSREYDVD